MSKKIGNLEIDKNKNCVVATVNPKIYPMNVIFSAAYVFIDRSFVVIDSNPDGRILVQLNAKDKKTDLEDLGKTFNNELVNYAFYREQYLKNNPVREAIIQRAFLTQVQFIEQPKEGESRRKMKKIRKGGKKVGKGKGGKRKKRSKSRS